MNVYKYSRSSRISFGILALLLASIGVAGIVNEASSSATAWLIVLYSLATLVVITLGLQEFITRVRLGIDAVEQVGIFRDRIHFSHVRCIVVLDKEAFVETSTRTMHIPVSFMVSGRDFLEDLISAARAWGGIAIDDRRTRDVMARTASRGPE